MPCENRPSFTVGDTAPALTGQVRDGEPGSSAPVDLTSAVGITVHLLRPTRGRPVLVKQAAVVDAAAGTWEAAWVGGDLDEAGRWLLEVQVQWPTGVQTFGRVPFWVREEYA